MIKSTEIIEREDKTFRLIIFEDNDISQGYVAEKQKLYELYDQLRTLFKDIE